MREHRLYKQLQQIAAVNNYTIEQIESATKQQVLNLLEVDNLSDNFIANMKRLLLQDLQGAQDTESLAALRTQAVTWLENNFPDYNAEITRKDNKRIVTIYLDGK